MGAPEGFQTISYSNTTKYPALMEDDVSNSSETLTSTLVEINYDEMKNKVVKNFEVTRKCT